MTDLHHPLTPWSRDECVTVVRQWGRREHDRQIASLYHAGRTPDAIADQFAITSEAVKDIVRRIHLDDIRPHVNRKGGHAAPSVD